MTSAKIVEHLSGFYQQENDGIRDFWWTQNTAKCRVKCTQADNWVIFELGYPGSVPVAFTIAGTKSIEIYIMNGWQQLAFPLAELAPDKGMLTLSSSYEHSAPQETRKLSLMVSAIRIGKPNAYELNSAKIYRSLFRDLAVDCYPTFLALDTSSTCNMSCMMCVVDKRLGFHQHQGDRGLDNTRTYYTELLPYLSKIQLHATGEALMGDAIWEALELAVPHAARRSLEIELFTNGQLLDEEKIDRILASPMTDLSLSVDAATERTYRRIRGGNFNKLLTNISLLRKKAAGSQLRITMNMSLMRENIAELPDFIKLAHSLSINTVSFWPLFALGMPMPVRRRGNFTFYYKQQMLMYYPLLTESTIRDAKAIAETLGVHIGVTPAVKHDYSTLCNTDVPYPLPQEEFDTYVSKDNYFKTLEVTADSSTYKHCHYPWNTVFITDAKVFSPCLLNMYEGGIGSIGRDFMDAWNNPAMQTLRRHIIQDDIHRMCRDAQCVYVNKIY